MTNGSLAALVALGAFHGINPAMGWLFAVARGLQERSRSLLLQSLPAIAVGHAGSVGLVAVVVAVTGSVLTSRIVSIVGGVLLVGVGLWHLLAKRHFRWVGMRLSLWQLAGWSFLMASVHGAGLMLLPIITRTTAGSEHAQHLGVSGHAGHGAGSAALTGLFAAGVHTFAMFVAAGVVAVLVYEVFGLTVLRRAWVNLDLVWAVALVGAGTAAVLTAA